MTTYDVKAKDKVIDVLRLFLQHEQGNRVTIFNMNGLINRVASIFVECEQTKPKKEKGGV